MLPGIAGVAIYQINIIVMRLLASFLPDGSVSYLYYGQRLFEFPQGIFIVSLAQAALPMMSRQVADDDLKLIRHSRHREPRDRPVRVASHAARSISHSSCSV